MKVSAVDRKLVIAGARRVTEAQLARSPLLANLRTIQGEADIPIRSYVFLTWQSVVEGKSHIETLPPETACELFSVRTAGIVK
jgi:hypothetical protein